MYGMNNAFCFNLNHTLPKSKEIAIALKIKQLHPIIMKNKTSKVRKKNKKAMKKQEISTLSEFPAFTKPVPWSRTVAETVQAIGTYTWLMKACSCTEVVENEEYTVNDMKVRRDGYNDLWQDICRSMRSLFHSCEEVEEPEQWSEEELVSRFSFDMQGYREDEDKKWAVRVMKMWEYFPECHQEAVNPAAMLHLATSTLGMLLPCVAHAAHHVLVLPEMDKVLRSQWKRMVEVLAATFEAHGISVVYEVISINDYYNRLHMMSYIMPYDNCLGYYQDSIFRSGEKDGRYEDAYRLCLFRDDLHELYKRKDAFYVLLYNGSNCRLFTCPSEFLLREIAKTMGEEDSRYLMIPLCSEISIHFETGKMLLHVDENVGCSMMRRLAESDTCFSWRW